jgi:hypothetical protein
MCWAGGEGEAWEGPCVLTREVSTRERQGISSKQWAVRELVCVCVRGGVDWWWQEQGTEHACVTWCCWVYGVCWQVRGTCACCRVWCVMGSVAGRCWLLRCPLCSTEWHQCTCGSASPVGGKSCMASQFCYAAVQRGFILACTGCLSCQQQQV